MNESYSSEKSSKWQWFTCVIIPLSVELFLSFIIISIYCIAIIYPITKGASSTLWDIGIFLFSAPAWLYSFYSFLKHDINISKSLWLWPFSILKFASKNPLKVISAVIAISIVWHIFSQPLVDVNRLKGINDNVGKIRESIESVETWLKESNDIWKTATNRIADYQDALQTFSENPNASSLPNTKEELDIIISEYQSLLGFIN